MMEVGFLNNRRGMMGYLASFHSLRKKRPNVTAPKTKRQITVAEFQGKDIPPNSKANRNITVPPTTVMVPIQSMARIPARKGVLGVSIFKNTIKIRRATPPTGTAEMLGLWF